MGVQTTFSWCLDTMHGLYEDHAWFPGITLSRRGPTVWLCVRAPFILLCGWFFFESIIGGILLLEGARVDSTEEVLLLLCGITGATNSTFGFGWAQMINDRLLHTRTCTITDRVTTLIPKQTRTFTYRKRSLRENPKSDGSSSVVDHRIRTSKVSTDFVLSKLLNR